MITRIGQLWRLLLTAGGFLSFYVGGSVLSWLLVPMDRLRGHDTASRSSRSRRLTGKGFRLFHDYLRIMRVIDFDPRTLATELPAGRFMLIANHPTLIDVTALMATQVDMVCVVKGALFRSPVLGRLLSYCWHINGGSGGPTEGAGVMLDGVRRLDAGVSVLIFPEGSRSPEGGLRTFKRGAFEIACRADAIVVPVYVTCTPAVLAKEAPWYRVPPVVPRMQITVLPPMEPARWQGNSRAMAKDAHAGYLRLVRGEALGPWQSDDQASAPHE